MSQSPNYRLYFWFVSSALVFAKILLAMRPELDLFTEEAQYWLWSENLAWHYYSKPPMVAYLNWLSTSIFGTTELAIRLIPISFGLGIALLVYQFGTYLYSPKVGFWSAMILQAMPFWWLVSTFHTTDTSITFFWTLCFFLLYRGIKEDKKRWYALAGLAGAFGLMSKTVMLLAFPFLFLFLFQRRSLVKKWPQVLLFSAILSLGFLPMLIWNMDNDWLTFRHLAQLAGGGEGGESPSFLERLLQSGAYLGGQLAMVSVFLLPIFFASIWNVYKYRSQENFYLLLPAALTFLGFLGLSLGTEVIVNWPVFAYVGLPIIMSAWLAEQGPTWSKLRNWTVAISILLPLLLILPDLTFLKSIPVVKKGEKAIFRRMSGYEALSDRIDHLQDSLRLDQPYIFSETYHMASELAFYLPDHPQTYMLNMGARANQFDLWPGLEQFLGQNRHGIFVSWNYDSPGAFASFETLRYEEDFPVYFRGELLRTAKIQVWEKMVGFDPYVPETY
ncbi:ArnT family glycosyltransferase [Algoriphagus namhaensis]